MPDFYAQLKIKNEIEWGKVNNEWNIVVDSDSSEESKWDVKQEKANSKSESVSREVNQRSESGG